MTAPAVSVRQATSADALAIATTEARGAHQPWSQADVEAHLGDPSRVSYIACSGSVLGHVLASAAADQGEVLTIAVRPDARRQGVGRHLLHALYQQWRRCGVTTGWLEVRADNEAACSLYRSDGWRDAGLRKAYYRDGVDALVMRREVL
jgi:ribosomal-protein-alanine N-acetyltransferase